MHRCPRFRNRNFDIRTREKNRERVGLVKAGCKCISYPIDGWRVRRSPHITSVILGRPLTSIDAFMVQRYDS